jgi:uncharacterized membrane protein
MKAHREAENNRTQFQIDRIAFFSDAVIAIALTLMILEIKIPEMDKDMTIRIILHKYGWNIVWHAVALLVGFSTIGNLWMNHHQLFEHIILYDERLIRINLYFLFSIMLLPISIQFLFATNEPVYFKLLCYFANLSFSSFMYSLLVQHIFLKKNNFSSIKDKHKIFKLKLDNYILFVVFTITTILIAFNIHWFYIIFFVIPIKNFYPKIRNRLKKRKTAVVLKT